MIPTPHIEVNDKDKIAKTVIMPGDPLRAKYIAENFLENVELVNSVRNMLAYTGTYKGKKVTIMGSGMGMPSIGIYSYELYKFYDVECIIRVGSAGAYDPELEIYDVVLASGIYSESTYAKIASKIDGDEISVFEDVNKKITNTASDLNIDLKTGKIHSSDVFYRKNFEDFKEIFKKKEAICVEMESYALFANAHELNKKAACILTISDSLVNETSISSDKREKTFNNMIELALNTDI